MFGLQQYCICMSCFTFFGLIVFYIYSFENEIIKIDN